MQRLQPSGYLNGYAPNLLFSEAGIISSVLVDCFIEVSILCKVHNNAA